MTIPATALPIIEITASIKDHKKSVLKNPLFSRRTRFLRMSDLLFLLDMGSYPQMCDHPIFDYNEINRKLPFGFEAPVIIKLLRIAVSVVKV